MFERKQEWEDKISIGKLYRLHREEGIVVCFVEMDTHRNLCKFYNLQYPEIIFAGDWDYHNNEAREIKGPLW